MSDATSTVRGRCECGRRYRIRNATVGVRVGCPNCGREIEIRPDHLAAPAHLSTLRAADAAAGPADAASGFAADQPPLLEAIVLDAGELRPAAAGSVPGLTGERVFHTSEAMVEHLLRGWRYESPEDDRDAGQKRFVDQWLGPHEPRPRAFWSDLLASFYFAGSLRNAIIILITSATLAVVTLGVMLAIFSMHLVVVLFALIGLGFVVGQVLQFYLGVLVSAAQGDDEIDLIDEQFSFVEGLVVPMTRIVTITGLYAFPALAAAYYLPPQVENRALIIAAAALAGTLLWPMALMLVWLGGSLANMRPDRVVWAIARVGPVYGLAWLTVLLTVLAWFAGFRLLAETSGRTFLSAVLAPVWLLTTCYYFGYVLFRTLGVIYRHYGARLPWRLL